MSHFLTKIVGGQRSFCLSLCVTVFVAVLTGCNAPSSPSASAGGQGPRVVTSTTIFADFVRQVGRGRLASVDSIVQAGVDVEDYDPKPENIKNVAQADLVVYNGLALDRWITKLVQGAKAGVSTLVLSDGLPVLGKGESEDEDINKNGNPHFWLDVQYAKTYVQKIRDRLTALDPQGGPVYAQNTTAYLAQLDQLDASITQQVAKIPPANRKLVTFHDAFPYLAARYGFLLVGVIAPSSGQEPSPVELAELVKKVKAANVRAVFSEAQFSPRLMQTLAQEAGVRTVVTDLYNDSLGDPPADSYIGMMQHNIQQIVQALK